MTFNRRFLLPMGALALAAISTPGYAETIASYSGGSTTSNSPAIRIGFSFTTAGTTSDTYSDLVLTIYEDTGSTVAEAFGNGYLEAAEYTGAPNALSASSFIASTAASAGPIPLIRARPSEAAPSTISTRMGR